MAKPLPVCFLVCGFLSCHFTAEKTGELFKGIQTFHFGNTDFRGHRFEHKMKNGNMAYYLFMIKRFRKVSLVLNMIYSNDIEFEEIRHELSGLTIN